MIKQIRSQTQVLMFLGLLISFTACQQPTPYQRTSAWIGSLEHSLVTAKVRSDYGLVSIKKQVKKNGNSREGLEKNKTCRIAQKTYSQAIRQYR